MRIPLEVEFRNVSNSDGLRELVAERVEALEAMGADITRCRVVIERPHRHQANHQPFHVAVELGVPGRELNVTHDPGDDSAHEDPYQAVRDAFKAVKRQLRAHLDRQRAHH